MAERQDYAYVGPLDPRAEAVCRLDRESARRRSQPVDLFLQEATEIHSLTNGMEYRFVDSPDRWQSIVTFIAEEAECCGFLAFERWREGNEAVLRVLLPEDTGDA
jgi:hypothetical protein